jgi:phage shock protein A
MGFRWFRRRPAPAPDPLAAYDDLVSDLAGEAAELRRAAATLLTARSRFGRELSGMEQVARTLRDRADRARAGGDGRTAEVLDADAHREDHRAEGLREELARTETDVAQLEEAARRAVEQVDRLRSERDLAAARLTAGTALAAEAQRSRADRIRRLVAVDAARDEIERAHALAEVWREDREASGED